MRPSRGREPLREPRHHGCHRQSTAIRRLAAQQRRADGEGRRPQLRQLPSIVVAARRRRVGGRSRPRRGGTRPARGRSTDRACASRRTSSDTDATPKPIVRSHRRRIRRRAAHAASTSSCAMAGVDVTYSARDPVAAAPTRLVETAIAVGRCAPMRSVACDGSRAKTRRASGSWLSGVSVDRRRTRPTRRHRDGHAGCSNRACRSRIIATAT